MAHPNAPSNRRRAMLYVLLASVCGYFYFTRYWFWRDCIDAAQSAACVTPDGLTVNANGRYWAIPTILILIAALQLWFRRPRA